MMREMGLLCINSALSQASGKCHVNVDTAKIHWGQKRPRKQTDDQSPSPHLKHLMQERSDFGATGEMSYKESDYFSPDEEHEAT